MQSRTRGHHESIPPAMFDEPRFHISTCKTSEADLLPLTASREIGFWYTSFAEVGFAHPLPIATQARMLLGKRGIVGRWMSHFTSIPFPAPVSLLRAPCNAAPEPECQRRRAAYEGVNQVTSVHLGPKRMPKQHWGRRGNTSPHPRLGAAQARDRSLRRVPNVR